MNWFWVVDEIASLIEGNPSDSPREAGDRILDMLMEREREQKREAQRGKALLKQRIYEYGIEQTEEIG